MSRILCLKYFKSVIKEFLNCFFIKPREISSSAHDDNDDDYDITHLT